MAKRAGVYLMTMWLAWMAAPAATAEAVRDPFWPVGHVASEGGRAQAEQEHNLLDLSRLSPEEQAIIKSHLRVGGILEQRDSRYAIINSDVVREGDVMTVSVQGQDYRFLIRSLKPDNIALEPVQASDQAQTEP